MWSYGEDCQYPCSKHCVDQTCDRFNGSCLSGCDSGYHGPKCDQGKIHLHKSFCYINLSFITLRIFHDIYNNKVHHVYFWYIKCYILTYFRVWINHFSFVNSILGYSWGICQCMRVYYCRSFDSYYMVMYILYLFYERLKHTIWFTCKAVFLAIQKLHITNTCTFQYCDMIKLLGMRYITIAKLDLFCINLYNVWRVFFRRKKLCFSGMSSISNKD